MKNDRGFLRRHRVASAITAGLVGVSSVGGFIAYDQFNTAGGTRASKFAVAQIVKQAETIRDESAIKETLGKRIQIQRANAPAVDAIWYEPENRGAEPLPVFVYAHGGAWISFDAIDGDTFSQDIADRTPAVVVNVNYKLLQVEPFPYQQNELIDTVRWLVDNSADLNIDPNNIVVSGGSAGGHIAAAAALMLNRQGIDLRASVLEVPFLDFVVDGENDLGEFAGLVDQLLATFAPDAEVTDPVISPLRADEEELVGLSDTYFIVGLRDPLMKQAERYQRKLKAAGVHTGLKAFDTGHGYLIEKTKPDGETVSVSDVRNSRAADAHRIALLKHFFYGLPLPK
ncbi:alpha/beta hydrolase [Mycolicibacterium setense]